MGEPDAELVRALAGASAVMLLTGAGVSTACGLPDYRGPNGVWNTRTPVMFQDFLADPAERERDWRQHAEDWAAYSAATPGPVHRAAVELEKAGKLRALITQNIDGLHAAAGTSPGRLVEIHGTMAEVECVRCDRREPGGPYYRRFLEERRVPTCRCGGWMKAGVVNFGQSLRQECLERSLAAVRGCDLFIAMGSTLEVQPAALLGIQAARNGTPYFVLNRGDTAHDGHPLVTRRLEGDVNDLFPPAVAAALMMEG